MNAQSKNEAPTLAVPARPNLAGVATQSLVDKIGAGNYAASYINWARTLQMLREHAEGWYPEFVPAADGNILHRAPVGAFMLLRFRSGEHVTEPVPQAVMDNRNNAVPYDKITARDVTDTHRRGICLAAALTFGLAYELWAKMPLETGFADDGTTGDNASDGTVGSGGSTDDSTGDSTDDSTGMPDAEWSKLVQLVEATKSDTGAMCKHYGVKSLRLLDIDQYTAALESLNKKLAKMAREETNAKAKTETRGEFAYLDADSIPY